MSSGILITIVNRTHSNVLKLDDVSKIDWPLIMDRLSDREGYSEDDRPQWTKSIEYTTPSGKSIAEFVNGSDHCLIVVNGFVDGQE